MQVVETESCKPGLRSHSLMGKVIMISIIIRQVKRFICKCKIFRTIIIVLACIVLLMPISIVLLIYWFYAIIFDKRVLVISSPTGNLGNRLFLFSNFIGFAAENNFEVHNPAFYKYATCFESTYNHFLCKYPSRRASMPKNNRVLGNVFLKLVYCASAVVQILPNNSLFHTIVLKNNDQRLNLDSASVLQMLCGKRIVFFRGWLFIDQTNIAKHAAKIRKYFIPQKKFKETIDSPIECLKISCDLVFGIVVRQGDYKRWFDGKYFFSIDTYVQMMRQLKNLFPEKKVGFFICSDAELDTQIFSGFQFVFRSKHDLENRYTLAQCDYILSAPSTYGGWAAFYGHVPLCILSSARQIISLAYFRIVNNHTDLRDPGFPPDTDITDILIRNHTLR